MASTTYASDSSGNGTTPPIGLITGHKAHRAAAAAALEIDPSSLGAASLPRLPSVAPG